MRRLRLWAALLPAITAAAPAASTTYLVRPDGSGDVATIQAGIDSCAAGDTVLATCGTYLEHDLVMRSGVCLRGEGGDPDSVVIDAQSLGRVVLCLDVDSTARIEGFTLTGGLPQDEQVGYSGSGGGIYCNGSSPRITNCRILNNASNYPWGKGGGLRCDFSAPEVRDCSFQGNASTYGGAVYSAHRGPGFFSCAFLGNEASFEGGGVFLYVCGGSFVDCTFNGNEAPLGGALTARWIASPLIERSTFMANRANAGGAIHLESLSRPEILGCTFVRNDAAVGSAMNLVSGSEPVIASSIVAFGTGGEAVGSDGSSPTLLCCDLYGNEGGDWVGCLEGLLGVEGNIAADPVFCDLDAGDLRLHSQSPCLPGYHPDGVDCGLIGARPVGCPETDADDRVETRQRGALSSAAPNPFTRSTSIRYLVPAQGEDPWVSLSVHDPTGRRIRTLVDLPQRAGAHAARWDGTAESGRRVPPGTYFYRLQVGRRGQGGRAVLVR